MTSKCPQLKAFKVEYNHDTISYWEATLYLTGKQHYDLTGKQHYIFAKNKHIFVHFVMAFFLIQLLFYWDNM